MPVLPTAYFGSISWYRQLVSHPETAIDRSEIFHRQTFRNRCCIATPQGVSKLSIPVERVNGPGTKTADVRISNQKDWRKDHWQSLTSNYASAPYFEHYAGEVHDLIYSGEELLMPFNQAITEFMLKQFGFDVRFLSQSAGEVATNRDFEVIDPEEKFPGYQQVFFGNPSFHANLSVLDLLFCEGPSGRNYLLIK